VQKKKSDGYSDKHWSDLKAKEKKSGGGGGGSVREMFRKPPVQSRVPPPDQQHRWMALLCRRARLRRLTPWAGLWT
jgi:hypothetical protein